MPAPEFSGVVSPEPHGVARDRAHPDPVTSRPAGLRQPAVWLLAAATGAIAANLYYAQPLLHLMATAFAVGNGAVGLLVTVTQIAFAVGLVLLLPLADVVNGRRLFSVLLVVNAAGLAVVASSPDITVAIAGFAVVGLTNVAAQVIVPVAASMASDEQRGRVVGTVITGLLVGILLARTVSGLVSQAVGWRPLFYAAAGLMIVVLVVVRAMLPTAPGPRMRYREVLSSLALLYRTHHHLRVRSAYGLLGFAAFSLFWTTLAFLLTGPHYHYQVAFVGLFGLLGAAGATAATLAGRLRHPRRPVPTLAAVAVIAASFVVLWAGRDSIAWVIVGTLVLDVGVQGLHVLNQRTILELDSAARSRLNSVYLIFYFMGGAAGSAGGTVAWDIDGWPGVCTAGLVIAALASLLWAATVVGEMTRERRSVAVS